MITNLEARKLSDNSVFYRYQHGGQWQDGSAPDWDAFLKWLAMYVGA